LAQAILAQAVTILAQGSRPAGMGSRLAKEPCRCPSKPWHRACIPCGSSGNGSSNDSGPLVWFLTTPSEGVWAPRSSAVCRNDVVACLRVGARVTSNNTQHRLQTKCTGPAQGWTEGTYTSRSLLQFLGTLSVLECLLVSAAESVAARRMLQTMQDELITCKGEDAILTPETGSIWPMCVCMTLSRQTKRDRAQCLAHCPATCNKARVTPKGLQLLKRDRTSCTTHDGYLPLACHIFRLASQHLQPLFGPALNVLACSCLIAVWQGHVRMRISTLFSWIIYSACRQHLSMQQFSCNLDAAMMIRSEWPFQQYVFAAVMKHCLQDWIGVSRSDIAVNSKRLDTERPFNSFCMIPHSLERIATASLTLE